MRRALTGADSGAGTGASRAWWRLPVEWWWQSLPLRVISSVFGASVIVLVLGGFLLMRQASLGVMEAKRESVGIEARQALDAAQQQLNSADLTGDPNPDKKLTELALRFANRSGGSDQYDVIIISGGQTTTAGDVAATSVPDNLRAQVATSDDLLMAPTEVIYRDDTEPVPGIAAGSGLTLPGTGRYEIYFIFPLTQQVNILGVLQTAVITTGAILVVLLTFIAALVARQVVVPIRAARRAAESLASGNLDDRMKVRGRDDLARLATSMNYMASELQKQISQLEELSRVQQRFVSDVSHELRTPLTTVRMAAEVLYEARDDFDPIAARSAELLQTELDRFEALLTDLLEISRFDAGAAVLSVSEVDLRDIVTRVLDGTAQLAETSGSQIRVHAPEPAVAEVDARRIERVLRNLVVNAIEHGEGRPIDILVVADDHAIAVAVRDHGFGFEAAQAKLVFHRFWRGDPARARTVGGTGLGLAISMEDANLHRGWLTAWGRPGMGAQFRLTVPRRAGGVIESSPLPLVPRDLVLSTLADGIGKPVPALDPAPAVDSEAQRSDPTKLGSGPVAAGSSPASPPPAAPSPVPPSPVSPSPSDAAGAQR
ncbi:two-component system histidine kinase [Microlunatus phosphovorus NM-1]|uniref:Sensor histidine kinase MtrB n=1 Tax=Microlunatus phosphovorus (strain ATCC 700054 / DSM 10555 / JCM 9379 / NBRC 101784 / NCIMB 13414 / VKM Ac-1990 / NM-1) TaxID=1032480 RepID=F5XLK2_MICPN|nr:MtrAB system histidine kinase MtrB [Microlunatus phosphovorus]BAK36268.1 two-component system histidine kinase [Microlunatus phosphovorus NM-1]